MLIYTIDNRLSYISVYVVKNRENSNTVLSEAKTTYLINIKCVDSQNEGETKTLTVTVLHNQGPRLVKLSGSVIKTLKTISVNFSRRMDPY